MPKEYTLIGGNGTVVSPLEVTEDGDYVAGDSRAFNPVKVRTGGSSTLAGLTDVDISNPTDGQTLVYDAASQKWVNGAGGGGGLSQYQVTFINSGSAGTRYTVNLGSCALSDGNTSVYFIQTAVIVEEQITVTLYQPNGLAVLLQGNSLNEVDYSVMPVVTGNIEFSAELGFVITGNGTITLSAQLVS